jgi:hypothetical protein
LPAKTSLLARPREDRLQRPVVALRRDDVSCDERRDHGSPQIDMKKSTTNGTASPVSRMSAERHVVRPPVQDEDDDEDDGDDIAAPSPRYVFLWAGA